MCAKVGRAAVDGFLRPPNRDRTYNHSLYSRTILRCKLPLLHIKKLFACITIFCTALRVTSVLHHPDLMAKPNVGPECVVRLSSASNAHDISFKNCRVTDTLVTCKPANSFKPVQAVSPLRCSWLQEGSCSTTFSRIFKLEAVITRLMYGSTIMQRA